MAASGLSCIMRAIWLWYMDFLVVTCGLSSCCAQTPECTGSDVGSVALWYVGSQFPDQGLNLCPLHGKVDS